MLLPKFKDGLRVLRDAVLADRSVRSFQHFGDYFSAQTVLGYIGWVGYHNIGDDLLYEAFHQLFPETQVLIYGNQRCRGYHKWSYPAPVELTLYRSFVKKRLYDAVFLGGGTLIYDPWYLCVMREALKEQVPFIVFGTGIREVDYISRKFTTLDPDQVIAEWHECLGQAALVKVRGPVTAERLRATGIRNLEIIGDPALYALDYSGDAQERNVALSLGGEDSVVFGRQEDINELTIGVAKQLLSDGWNVEFLPMMDEDRELQESVLRKHGLSRVTIWGQYHDLASTMQHIGSFRLLLGQRLHAVILAAGSAVPVVSFAHCTKSQDFMQSFGLEHFCLRTDQTSTAQILSRVEEIESDYNGHRALLQRNCEKYRSLQEKAAAEVRNLITAD